MHGWACTICIFELSSALLEVYDSVDVVESMMPGVRQDIPPPKGTQEWVPA